MIKAPNKRENLIIRTMIIIGIISILNFFFWFFSGDFKGNKFTFILLSIAFIYIFLRVLYEWYHYWDLSIPDTAKPQKSFTVDILTTYFPGEPYEMIENTLLAIKNIEYPHETYLCDEANDDRLKKFCEVNGIHHISRDNRINAKAGNINNALLTAKGEICVILDPDHVPPPDFLKLILPQFTDNEIGFVQVVQAYKNIDESYVSKGAAQQTFQFYGPMMMTMNSYGTVNAIGANCTFRRAALDSIGGHAPGLAEDMHTAMQLHAKGWRSVYLPMVSTRGLAPSSLTAYFKQQLKWSRGTLELLVSVYPKLFKAFTFRQKLHYAFIPLHYLIGIIYFINFMIPVISLLTYSMPWKGNMVFFSFILLPVLVSTLIVRIFVQNWVMEEDERGIHAIGGLLQITAWWVFCLGFFYTLLRKNVPYLPTPKTGDDKTSWKLRLPNLIIAILSLTAVYLGLKKDFTPFSIGMSVFAIFNTMLMLSVFYLADHRYKDVQKIQHPLMRKVYSINLKFKKAFWKFRHKLYKSLRAANLKTVLLSVLITFSYFTFNSYLKWEGINISSNTYKPVFKDLGIYSPSQTEGVTTLKSIRNEEKSLGVRFSLISQYWAWDDRNTHNSKIEKFLSDAEKGSYNILLTWEPWIEELTVSKSNDHKLSKQNIYRLINQGLLDNSIKNLALQLKKFKGTIYLRFSHEFDNPQYPWGTPYKESATDFIKAWQRVHQIFSSINAGNIKWVWNPWKSASIKSYYPGDPYVDYIGLNILNYHIYNPDRNYYSFKELYSPFQTELINSGIQKPIIITEFGSINDKQEVQKNWIKDGLNNIYNEHDEIAAVILFNNKEDNNIPSELSNESIDWSVQQKDSIKDILASLERKHPKSYKNDELILPEFSTKPYPIANYSLTTNIKGVNYKKGGNWYQSYKVLDRHTLEQDFSELKKLNVDYVCYWGNPVYNYNFLNIAAEFKMNISYGIWLPGNIFSDFDDEITEEAYRNIIGKIQQLKKYPNIKSWHISNDILNELFMNFHSNELRTRQKKYLIWLHRLIREIKKIDPEKNIVIELDLNKNTVYHCKLLASYVSGIDAIGLNVTQTQRLSDFNNYATENNIAYLITDIKAAQLQETDGILTKDKAIFLRNWQDRHENNLVSFDGLLDQKGNFKWDYALFKHYSDSTFILPEEIFMRILKPSVPIHPGKKCTYSAIIFDKRSKTWKYSSKSNEILSWYLIKYNNDHVPVAFTELGSDTELNIKIPEDYSENYGLLLKYNSGGYLKYSLTTLNTKANTMQDDKQDEY